MLHNSTPSIPLIVTQLWIHVVGALRPLLVGCLVAQEIMAIKTTERVWMAMWTRTDG
jgi:hypothetical protein